MNRIEKEEKKTCDDKKKIHAMKLSKIIFKVGSILRSNNQNV